MPVVYSRERGEAEPPKKIKPTDLARVIKTAQEFLDLERQIAQTEIALSGLKERHKQMQFGTVVDLFNNVKVSHIGIEDVDVQILPYYQAAIKKDNPNKAQAFGWLETNGHGDLMKHVFTIELGRDQVELAKKFHNWLIKQKLPFSEDISVHHATLTAWVKDQLTKHHAVLPLELLGATVGQIAKIVKVEKPKT